MSSWTEQRHSAVTVLSYCNPPRNFLTFAALAELGERLARLASDEGTSVVVLRSDVAGYFVAHADLDELATLASGPVPEARAWYSTMRLIETMPQPVIAAVDGQAWGGGVELSLACTLRWASTEAHFALIETALGIIPGSGGTQRLVRLIGRGVATDLVLSGDVISASRAHDIGLVSRLLDPEGFDDAVLAAATDMATKPRAALAAAKRVLQEGSQLAMSEALKLEGTTFGELLGSAESAELQARARNAYAAAPDDGHIRFDLEGSVG